MQRRDEYSLLADFGGLPATVNYATTPTLPEPAAKQRPRVGRNGAHGTATHDLPEELVCPLSGTLLQDPVYASDGAVYSRGALLDWLRTDVMGEPMPSPLTGEPLYPRVLNPAPEWAAATEEYRTASAGTFAKRLRSVTVQQARDMVVPTVRSVGVSSPPPTTAVQDGVRTVQLDPPAVSHIKSKPKPTSRRHRLLPKNSPPAPMPLQSPKFKGGGASRTRLASTNASRRQLLAHSAEVVELSRRFNQSAPSTRPVVRPTGPFLDVNPATNPVSDAPESSPPALPSPGDVRHPAASPLRLVASSGSASSPAGSGLAAARAGGGKETSWKAEHSRQQRKVAQEAVVLARVLLGVMKEAEAAEADRLEAEELKGRRPKKRAPAEGDGDWLAPPPVRLTMAQFKDVAQTLLTLGLLVMDNDVVCRAVMRDDGIRVALRVLHGVDVAQATPVDADVPVTSLNHGSGFLATCDMTGHDEALVRRLQGLARGGAAFIAAVAATSGVARVDAMQNRALPWLLRQLHRFGSASDARVAGVTELGHRQCDPDTTVKCFQALQALATEPGFTAGWCAGYGLTAVVNAMTVQAARPGVQVSAALLLKALSQVVRQSERRRLAADFAEKDKELAVVAARALNLHGVDPKVICSVCDMVSQLVRAGDVPRLVSAISSKGFVENLAIAAASPLFKWNPDIHVAVAAALGCVCQTHALRSQANVGGAMDGATLCITALGLSLPHVQSAGLRMAAAVVAERSGAVDFLANGLLRPSWKALLTLHSHPVLQGAAWGCFANLFVHDDLRMQVLVRGLHFGLSKDQDRTIPAPTFARIVLRLVESMLTHHGVPENATACFHVLWNLPELLGYEPLESPRVLLHAMIKCQAAHATNPGVQAAAWGAFANLCGSSAAFRDAVVGPDVHKSGLMTACLATLETHMGHSGCVDSAANAIAAMAIVPSTQPAFASMGAIPVLLKALDVHAALPAVLASVVNCIGNLASDGGNRAAMGPHMVRTLMGIVKFFQRDAANDGWAAGMGPTARYRTAPRDATTGKLQPEKMLPPLTASDQQQAGLQVACAHALRNLMLREELVVVALDHGIIDLCVSTWFGYQGDKEASLKCLSVLVVIATTSVEYRDLIFANAGNILLMLKMLRQASDKETVAVTRFIGGPSVWW